MGNSQSLPDKSASMSSSCLLPEEEESYPPAWLQQGAELSSLCSEPACSICLGGFSDPVRTECGHEFCRRCIETFWADHEPTCPQCRRVCDPARTVSREEAPGRPVQLVEVGADGSLLLHQEVLQDCFLCQDVGQTPVCVVAIVGERRMGKSFLLNYLLRKLSRMERVEDWMDDEGSLRGFEWQPGTKSTTRGIFIWDRPLFLETLEGRTAVFLLDSEGCMDLDRKPELSVKLLALSVLLSSHLIFNVRGDVKTSELEYLELLCQVLEQGGDAFRLQHLQGFDFLVRDWTQSAELGENGGAQHLDKIVQRLQDSGRYEQALRILRERSPSCFLLPFPGNRLVRSQRGSVQDMDEEFQFHLKDYINHTAQVLERRQPTETGATLSGKFKEAARVILQGKYSISSPAELISALKLQKAKQEFANFLQEQGTTVIVSPAKMEERVRQKEAEVLEGAQRGVLPRDMGVLWESVGAARAEFLQIHRIKFGLTVGGLVTVPLLGVAGGVAGGVVAGAAMAAEAGVVAVGTGIGATAGLGVGGMATAVATAIYRRFGVKPSNPEPGEH
ncbi:RING finger protein 112-like [Lepisosteus oculatus]|uniref:RING finger protein 112-like n=1 Tax=Lepisosteus oculatus TaxID=7918 RepID=UPI0035F52B73